ncbi:MAG: hypothetical protein LBM98_04135 [Oscillospiraceae bacterium]|nr:hypothetical protein [Oscillospiraceae bacterium]
MRYVPLRPARQSSAGGVTYVSVALTTGLLRTCNIVCIASLPVLRNDGGIVKPLRQKVLTSE